MIALAFGSEPDDETAAKCGRFLTLCSFEGNVITSGMFLTAMAANPLAAKLAGEQGVKITWGGWALAAIVPGLISLLVMPLVIYWIWPPALKRTENATGLAREKLAEMGPVKTHEWIMLGVFLLLLGLWIFAPTIGGTPLDATSAAFVGLAVLLLTGVLSWDDILAENAAWDTLIWFAALVMMETELNSQGIIPWFSKQAGLLVVAGMGWGKAFIMLVLLYPSTATTSSRARPRTSARCTRRSWGSRSRWARRRCWPHSCSRSSATFFPA